MSKLYKKTVQVQMQDDTLIAFLWNGRWLKVESVTVVNRRRSFWERDPSEIYRVKARSGGVYDLIKDKTGWVLERVWG